jgi:hypothetical protein
MSFNRNTTRRNMCNGRLCEVYGQEYLKNR